jgi:arylsulfatase A-like enzyme
MARPGNGNVLLITLDQLRADAVEGPLGDCVALPNLRRLAARGCVFGNHHTVTAPCGPARASLLTGLYAFNHRVTRNGAPLDRRHATVASQARRAGYEPLLFGYSDQAVDPEGLDPEDPDLSTYEGVARGFREIVEMRMEAGHEWRAHLLARGYRVEPFRAGIVPDVFRPVAADGGRPKVGDPALYSAANSDTAYLADRTLEALEARRHQPWFAHVAFVRPHPPLVAPAPWHALVDPQRLPKPSPETLDHPFVAAWASGPSNVGLHYGFDGNCAAIDAGKAAQLRATYLGLVAEADRHVGRILDWLDATGQADRTLVVLTSDHGDMLGDRGMWGKESVFAPVFRIPLLVAGPGVVAGCRIGAPTESVDIAPTLLEWIGLRPPPAFDGHSLLALMRGEAAQWRTAAFAEIDFSHPLHPTRFQRHLGLAETRCNAAVLAGGRWKYVHFNGGLPPLLFDLAEDPAETRNLAGEPALQGQIADMARRMLDLRMARADRRLTGLAIGA